MNGTEKHIASEMQKSTKATVQAGNRQSSPLWTPGLAEPNCEIAAAPQAERSQRLKLRHREVLREVPKSRWHTLRSKLESADGNSRQIVRRAYATRSLSMPAMKADGLMLSRHQRSATS
ncbi:Tbingi protein [Trypanosoma cruzi]|nr:Tbingi protein [Trypanosoma cruzi]